MEDEHGKRREKPLTYIVTDNPPWYRSSEYNVLFSCKDTEGLFNAVADLMVSIQLSEEETTLKPRTVQKLIRNEIIRTANTLKQKPSLPLLLAVMDLVEMKSETTLPSTYNVDKAGLKHMLLAHDNYTSICIPNESLRSSTGKRVIPIVTQYSGKHNLVFYDSTRSMLGTYNVDLLNEDDDVYDDESNNSKSAFNNEQSTYFIQEVMFVPGHKSLHVLKEVAGDTFEFWDMALEVPTHCEALTPSFREIQDFQLLRTDHIGENPESTVSNRKKLKPLCCLVEKGSEPEYGSDCFLQHQVSCELTQFRYENGGTPTVYMRETDGEQLNLLPVVTLKEGQRNRSKLYVSTTLRFYRAVQQCHVRGAGEHVSCWNETLKELERETFTVGPEIYQDIHHPALSTFRKRVNPNSWCNYLPNHIESAIKDPVISEAIQLGIRFMANDIPNPFASAELLVCPLARVEECLSMWRVCSSVEAVYVKTRQTRRQIVGKQMITEWRKLTEIMLHVASGPHFGTGKVSGCRWKKAEFVNWAKKVSECEANNEITKAHRMWNSLLRSIPDRRILKELAHKVATAKVLLLKLRTYNNKLKNDKIEWDQQQGESQLSPGLTQKYTGEDDNFLYSIVTPNQESPLPWIKNLSTLLLCEPWLNGDVLRREAVCVLLGLHKTLLTKENGDVLSDWVNENRSVVNILRSYNLDDTLSKSLVNCLDSTSVYTWREKIANCFQNKNGTDIPSDKVVTKSHGVHSVTTELIPEQKRTSRMEPSKKKRSSHVEPSLSKKSRSPKKKGKTQHAKKPSANGNLWCSEAEECFSEVEEDDDNLEQTDEEERYGDTLAETLSYDEGESFDEYDSRDSFIDDGPLEILSSSEEEVEEERYGRKRKVLYREKPRRRRKRVYLSDSETDEQELGSCSHNTSNTKAQVYTQTLHSDSEEDLTKPEGKKPSSTSKPRGEKHTVASGATFSDQEGVDCPSGSKPKCEKLSPITITTSTTTCTLASKPSGKKRKVASGAVSLVEEGVDLFPESKPKNKKVSTTTTTTSKPSGKKRKVESGGAPLDQEGADFRIQKSKPKRKKHSTTTDPIATTSQTNEKKHKAKSSSVKQTLQLECKDAPKAKCVIGESVSWATDKLNQCEDKRITIEESVQEENAKGAFVYTGEPSPKHLNQETSTKIIYGDTPESKTSAVLKNTIQPTDKTITDRVKEPKYLGWAENHCTLSF